ncbi:MAG: tRNA (adenosine(37)-N6)-threonylcarbamoyltransferase complex transferase subunit TsaD [Defluviitaleaceae bacterium]|nr:tRNA (adenosine(37)-N6)-threonylcarbamoyltransferase complex transferase subunit TsaD [Defluviitaleaceae bacterium]MCL2275075.1 tRNA (adenosine(37)-N6)-threonylcarbamoyltransferase complex transferase subunit TsaD [Defluviitaleaceae bacterium]
MIILGIETSCDETSAAVVKDGRRILSNIIASQTEVHAPFGGVVPELAARRHIEAIGYITEQALSRAGILLEAVDAFAVANGPGLVGALLVGVNYAKGLAFAQGKPLVGVHHIEGHVCANLFENDLAPPFLSLVVSGGHTILIEVRDYNVYHVLGGTMDDAAGEAFDKVARLLGLPFPGGPQVDKLAQQGNPHSIAFPRAKVGEFSFSFSGLKTAVMQYLAKNKNFNAADVAASFQQAVVEVLAEKTIHAAQKFGYNAVALAGGVACNRALRAQFENVCTSANLQLHMPTPVLCTDNAAMIAARGYYQLQQGPQKNWDMDVYPARMTAQGDK